MIDYARKDTHFLMFLTKSLFEKIVYGDDEEKADQKIAEIFKNCQVLCLKTFKKPWIFTEKYFKFLKVLQNNCSSLQCKIYEDLWVKLSENEKPKSQRIGCK